MASTASTPLYLAIDQGGHASRAIVFDSQAGAQAMAEAPVATLRSGDDRVEQDADAVAASVREVAERVLAKLGGWAAAVAAGGLATQRSSLVCWDRRTGAALSPVLSWQDRRAAKWLAGFAGEAERVHARTGLVLSAHYGASKFRWCLDHLPGVREALAEGRLALGPMASFLLFRLLAERPHVVDPANASRTLLWDFQTRDWAADLLDLFGVPRVALPACVPTRHAFGHFEAGAWRIPFRVMTGDQAAALFAGGAPAPQDAFANIGTGAFVQRIVGDKPVRLPGLLSGVVLEENGRPLYVVEGTVNGASVALETVAGELGLRLADVLRQAPAWLAAATRPPLFLNGVSGLGSPYWVPDFPSRFVGAGEAPARIVAVLESIVFLLAVNLEALRGLSPMLRCVRLTGGLAALAGLAQRLADVSGLAVVCPEFREATARGLAYLVAGCPAAWPAAEARTFAPQPAPGLRRRYASWRCAMEEALPHAPRPTPTP